MPPTVKKIDPKTGEVSYVTREREIPQISPEEKRQREREFLQRKKEREQAKNRERYAHMDDKKSTASRTTGTARYRGAQTPGPASTPGSSPVKRGAQTLDEGRPGKRRTGRLVSVDGQAPDPSSAGFANTGPQRPDFSGGLYAEQDAKLYQERYGNKGRGDPPQKGGGKGGAVSGKASNPYGTGGLDPTLNQPLRDDVKDPFAATGDDPNLGFGENPAAPGWDPDAGMWGGGDGADGFDPDTGMWGGSEDTTTQVTTGEDTLVNLSPEQLVTLGDVGTHSVNMMTATDPNAENDAEDGLSAPINPRTGLSAGTTADPVEDVIDATEDAEDPSTFEGGDPDLPGIPEIKEATVEEIQPGNETEQDAQDALEPPPDVEETVDAEEETEEGTRDFDAEWRNQMSDVMATHESQYDDIVDMSYQEEARLGRQAAAQAARLGYSAGGGGYGAAMAQASMSGQEMRTKALLQHQQKGLDMRMGFLDKMFQRAQQEDDQEMQRWVQEEQNRTLTETTYIDALLSASPETIEEAVATGLIPRDVISGAFGDGGTGNGGTGGDADSTSGRYDFGDSYSDTQQQRMNDYAQTYDMNAKEVKDMEDSLSGAVNNLDRHAIYDLWDSQPEDGMSKKDMADWVRALAQERYTRFLEDNNLSEDDPAAKAEAERINNFMEDIADKSHISWGDVLG